MNRRFTDLSSNNALYSASKYAAWGAVIVGNKITQGTSYVNPTWLARAIASHKEHVAVIFYHFAQGGGRAAGEAQARFFLDTLKAAKIYNPKRGDCICLDIEQGGEVADPVSFKEGFERVCYMRGHGSDLVVYSDEAYFQQYGRKLAPKKGKRIWVAAYPSLFHWLWGRPWAHQFTDKALIPGVGSADCSYLSHSAWAWHRSHRP